MYHTNPNSGAVNNYASAQMLKQAAVNQVAGTNYAGAEDLGASLRAGISQDRPNSFLENTSGRLNFILHELASLNARLYRSVERSIGSFPTVAGGVNGEKGPIIAATAHEIEAKLERIYAEINVMSDNISRVETII